MFIFRTLIECLILRIDSSSVARTADMLGVLLISAPGYKLVSALCVVAFYYGNPINTCAHVSEVPYCILL